jgi:hypothetical protein
MSSKNKDKFRYEAWKVNNDDGRGWRIKYYKGLGTNTSKEAKEYFTNISRHQIQFKWDGTLESPNSLEFRDLA